MLICEELKAELAIEYATGGDRKRPDDLEVEIGVDDVVRVAVVTLDDVERDRSRRGWGSTAGSG